jgi:DNA topoisomerase-3
MLRERLKEAKGIGTPATRAEVIRGLKQQDFLQVDGKHIVPTERGLTLFAVLERADPALVDPGVTAQMERLLDDVLLGQQDMVSAIDAVCAQASRIIGRLQEGGCAVDASVFGSTVVGNGPDRPPTPAMKNFVDSLAQQEGLKPPQGYTKSGAACRVFLDQHASGKAPPQASTDTQASLPAARPSPYRQIVGVRRMPGSTGRATPPARNRNARSEQLGQKAEKTVGSKAAKVGQTSRSSEQSTPLRIPFGNKEAALQLGARYGAGGWYAPPGIDLAAFRSRGWL